MAAVMTQTQCASSDDTRSPGSVLKLGSPPVDAESMRPEALLKDANSVFDIAPETALLLFCNNVEKLVAHFEKLPASASSFPNSNGSTPMEPRTPTEEEPRSVGLHCGDAEDANGDRSKEDTFQLRMLSRKFLSKKIPPIALKDYLQRLHKYCPMSTAVLLAASVYITRMALVEKVVRPSPKNMHRLVLAGVLVATKALEDLSFPHSRVAKVGGVSEQELSKLEITFCFLADFDLRVDARMLMDEARMHCTENLQLSEPESSEKN
ncbi:uncharacterized protein N7496_008560 [Penicillium cataractarum]|uniref:Uncharacterized protein n=1 Tax=Penicillium cataractarum TaxID=2100454 RepID=A0A9W9V718_9EURO|nr:uncharacterized protein N7496_008560 [Penicillium cataractarum]KAJ5368800.1 hypothetical protein N7496_008560 [Penicillium cataractarum]